MFILHLTIHNLGALTYYDTPLYPEINLLRNRCTDELSAALAFLLCSDTHRKIPTHWLQRDTCISAKICLGDAIYTLWATPEGDKLRLFAADPQGNDVTDVYRYALSHSPEQDAAEYFDGLDRTYPFRLCHYRYPETPWTDPRQFFHTKTFRQQLLQYIQNFRPEPINCKKNFFVNLTPRGEFEVVCPHQPPEILLSESEEKLFLYVCFLNVAEFWAEAEKLRDLHRENKPLVIKNFLEFLDASTDVCGLIARTMRLPHQVIFLDTTPKD